MDELLEKARYYKEFMRWTNPTGCEIIERLIDALDDAFYDGVAQGQRITARFVLSHVPSIEYSTNDLIKKMRTVTLAEYLQQCMSMTSEKARELHKDNIR